ncbi:L-xylulose reductase [Arctopsyche grandis]|uniref:L-xylulose reductase n=1 Tax=Arctopsyche grandis TaxID=121162 RepID=UPI00406D6E97
MEISFKGKNIIVTGAGQGIGRAICVRLAEYGANVIAVSKTEANLKSLKDQVSVETVCVDLGQWDAARNAIQKAIKNKPIHGLVNNAAIAQLEPFLDAKPESFDTSFNINVKSALNMSQIVAKNMIGNKLKGSIVNISSQASKAGLVNHAIYCATKGALDALSRAMTLELGPHNIRVNCVNPTVIMTEMGKLGWSDPARAEPMLQKIPLRRFGEVSEVVDGVMYLLSDRSSMITGAAIPIDGGFLAC